MILKYREYRDLINKTNNPISALVMAFKDLHDNAPVNDFENLGGRLAGICKCGKNDFGYVMKIIWESCTAGINGSHLNYINAIISKNQVYKKINQNSPNKYISGKYGHMVKR